MHLLSKIFTLLLLGFPGALGTDPDDATAGYAPEGEGTGSSLRRRLVSEMPAKDYGSISGRSMETKVEATVTSEREKGSLFVQIEFVEIDGDTTEDEGRDANTEKKPGEPDIDIVIDSDGS